jgi:multidrug efflux pump subunit AcrB
MTNDNRGMRPLVVRHNRVIFLLAIVLCIGGVYSAIHMPAAVFPQTDFPRVVVLIDNGEMPADEMMATITRPVEEMVKDIPGVIDIRSATGRGSAEVNVFFDGDTDMITAELFVLNRVATADLPPTSSAHVERLTFSSFPILGISLVSDTRTLDELWQMAEYEIKPRLLRIPGVARIKLVGGDVPEYHVAVDPQKLAAHRLTLSQVAAAVAASNTFTPAGMHEEDHQLYLNVIDGRAGGLDDLAAIPVVWEDTRPITVGEVATVQQGVEPRFNIVSANGHDAVLLNVYSQPNGNTVAIADALNYELEAITKELPPGLQLGFFYDQSQFVREGVRSVWESIIIGLIFSIIVLYVFLRNFGITLVAAAAIPTTILITLVTMHVLHMSFNLMTLGGIAAAIGLVIDDAIVIVEAIYTKSHGGESPASAIRLALGEVGFPLIGSTLTPVVVFLPLVFLDGIAGVFF